MDVTTTESATEDPGGLVAAQAAPLSTACPGGRAPPTTAQAAVALPAQTQAAGTVPAFVPVTAVGGTVAASLLHASPSKCAAPTTVAPATIISIGVRRLRYAWQELGA